MTSLQNAQILSRPEYNSPVTETETLIDIAPSAGGLFDRKPFLVRHHLDNHPLFGLSRLMQLAQYLPRECIEYNAGDLPVSLGDSPTPGNGLSVEETLRRIRDCRSWMVLKNVERDTEYAKLLEQCLDEVSMAVGGRIANMRQQEGFIFVSSPGSITPYHMDPEHNFLLQISGSKTVAIFDPADRELIPHETLERFHSGFRRKLILEESHRGRAREFRLEPGTGLHFPVTAPHWVRNGDDVSVSFSITFRSRSCDRRETLYRINASLRKIGISPVAPGQSAWRDGFKLGIHGMTRSVKRALRRARRPDGASVSRRGARYGNQF
ncbi:MAG TPA: cupin-like domain-containing protein [Gammaproteobacteria bacterium]|nr:cupin-like domain-containing protein [Gammaproteobacteria bacterium]